MYKDDDLLFYHTKGYAKQKDMETSVEYGEEYFRINFFFEVNIETIYGSQD